MSVQDFLAILIVWSFLIWVWRKPFVSFFRSFFAFLFLKIGKISWAMRLKFGTPRKHGK